MNLHMKIIIPNIIKSDFFMKAHTSLFASCPSLFLFLKSLFDLVSLSSSRLFIVRFLVILLGLVLFICDRG